jgi:hypothetical protein
MRVVVEGEHSDNAHVDSSVPQSTVLGPLLFFCHITLQEDLKSLELWADKWGMKFNAKTCYKMSMRQKSSYFYQLDQHILEQVKTNPYLGFNISDDLKWSSRISKITSKASCTLGFLRRNLRQCPQECNKLAYLAMVRSTLEYGCLIWDPYIPTRI